MIDIKTVIKVVIDNDEEIKEFKKYIKSLGIEPLYPPITGPDIYHAYFPYLLKISHFLKEISY